MDKAIEQSGILAIKARIQRAEARVESAEARSKLAETRTDNAKIRAESAETRTEKAETRTEFAKTRTENAEIRTELAETRAEQAESILEKLMQNEDCVLALGTSAVDGTVDQRGLARLTVRQREVLKLIARGYNTKQIGDRLKVSPKTIEYHRLKLMGALKVHNIPGLVRFALRLGLIPPEG